MPYKCGRAYNSVQSVAQHAVSRMRRLLGAAYFLALWVSGGHALRFYTANDE